MSEKDSADGVSATGLPESVGRRGIVSSASLLLLQMQNAFNDNLARFMLVSLGVWHVSKNPEATNPKHLLALFLVLPFILFSPLAGWLADRFRKNVVIRQAAWAQIVVLAFMAFALSQRSMALACLAFFLLATQSALLSPAKLGIVKELVGSKRLTLMSGLMEATVIAAILGGQIFAGLWFDARLKVTGEGWSAALNPVVILTGTALLALISAYAVQKTPKHPAPKLSKKVVFSHWREMKILFARKDLKLVALGAAFFWGYAGALNLLSIQVAEEVTGGDEGYGTQLAYLMMAASGGIVGGSLIAGLISRKGIDLGLVVVGALVMTVCTFTLAWQPLVGAAFYIFLALTGAGGAFMVVPLTAYLQEESPADKRGSIMASGNVLVNIFGASAVGIQLAMESAGLSVRAQLLLLSLLALVVFIIALRHLMMDFLRLVVGGVLQIFFKIEVHGLGNVPREGGAILAPNHVTYLDTILLGAVNKRSVRYLIASDMAEKWWIKPVVGAFQAVPVDSKRPRAAITTAADTLKAGGLLGIFPEGKLTRDGGMSPLQPGFALIAKKADAPVIPVHMDGLWGALFSHSGRGAQLKFSPFPLRRPLKVEFGEELEGEDLRRELESWFLSRTES